MSSYEKRFYVTNPSVRERLQRNWNLAKWLTSYLFAWFGRGRKLRKAYRNAQRSGKAIALEDYLDDGQQ